MDDDLDAGMDPLRDPCAQAAVCRAEVTASRRVAQETSEMPPGGGIAGGDSRRCEIRGAASATLIVAVVVTLRVLVRGAVGPRAPWGGPGGNHRRVRVRGLEAAVTLAMGPSGLGPALTAAWPGQAEDDRESGEERHEARENFTNGTVYSAASRCSVPGHG